MPATNDSMPHPPRDNDCHAVTSASSLIIGQRDSRYDDRGASTTVEPRRPWSLDDRRQPASQTPCRGCFRGGAPLRLGPTCLPSWESELNSLASWPDRMREWMNDNFLLAPEGREEYNSELAKQRERIKRSRQRPVGGPPGPAEASE